MAAHTTVPSPALDHGPCPGNCFEPVQVEAIVPERPVKGLDEGIVGRFPWSGEVDANRLRHRHLARIVAQSRQQGAREEFGLHRRAMTLVCATVLPASYCRFDLVTGDCWRTVCTDTKLCLSSRRIRRVDPDASDLDGLARILHNRVGDIGKPGNQGRKVEPFARFSIDPKRERWFVTIRMPWRRVAGLR